MVFPALWWIPVIVSFLLCAEGFYRFVWFMSVGYGLSVAGIGLSMMIMSVAGGQFHWVYALQCIITIAYGIRLGGFLLFRELKNAKYREKMAQVGGDVKPPIFVSVFMWVFCGFIYVMQCAGLEYRYFNGDAASPKIWVFIGIIICLIGVIIESLADKQKNEQKKLRPDMPAMDGLYKLCRCPNYLGELLFWTGMIISGIGSLHGLQWLVALIGYAEIVIVMLSGAKRVEGRHIKNYGENPEYQAYANSVPLLFPFTKMYHMTSPEKMAKEAEAKALKAAKRGKKNG